MGDVWRRRAGTRWGRGGGIHGISLKLGTQAGGNLVGLCLVSDEVMMADKLVRAVKQGALGGV